MRHLVVVPLIVATLFGCGGSPKVDAGAPNDRKLTENERWARRLKCQEIGSARERADDAAQRNAKTPYILLRPQYCYSETLNTCIYEEIFTASNDQSTTIYDLLSGEVLEGFSKQLGEPTNATQLQNENEFKQKRKILFDACAK